MKLHTLCFTLILFSFLSLIFPTSAHAQLAPPDTNPPVNPPTPTLPIVDPPNDPAPTEAPTPTPPPPEPSPTTIPQPTPTPQIIQPIVVTFPNSTTPNAIAPTPTPELVPRHIVPVVPPKPSPKPATAEERRESTGSAIIRPPFFNLWTGPTQDFYKSSRLTKPVSMSLGFLALIFFGIGTYIVEEERIRRIFQKNPQGAEDKSRYIYYFSRPGP